MIKPVILLSLLMLSGCASVQSSLSDSVFYERDLFIDVNGQTGKGILVVEKAPEYKFKVESVGKINGFTLESCHRYTFSEDIANGSFGPRKQAKFSYVPVAPIESENCDVLLGAFEVKGRSGWGYVAFNSPEYTEGALVKCSGNQYNSKGVTLCQSRAGLIQSIEFSREMKIEPNTDCPVETKDNKLFVFNMSLGICQNIFKVKGEAKYHRLVTIGFEATAIRGE